MDWSHQAFWLEASSVSQALRFVTERGEPGVVDAACPVVSELVTHVVRHAHAGFELSLAPADDRVLLRVRDGSPGRPPVREVAADSLDGPGLALVEVLSSEWGVADVGDGTTWVWTAFDVLR